MVPIEVWAGLITIALEFSVTYVSFMVIRYQERRR